MAARKIIINSLDDLKRASAEFISLTSTRRLFAIAGTMGAGKTTFIKALCDTLGSADVVTSPTFTLVNEYSTESGGTIYHFDFYRVNKIEEVFDFGFEEYITSGEYCFIEWPELVEGLLPEDVVNVTISARDDQSRIVEIEI